MSSMGNSQLKPHEVHIWYMYVQEDIEPLVELLSKDEIERANRFHFPIHRQRFIAARGNLRLLLSQYENIPPQDIVFSYCKFGKPYLQNTFLRFNVSHSQGLAVYAFTLQQRIGIDVQSIEKKSDNDVAKRFFSKEENRLLSALTEEERKLSFYKIWAKKEALIKAIGLGMKISLSSFSVSLSDKAENIFLENAMWQLHHLDIDPNYESAFAVEQRADEIIIREWRF